MTTPITDPVARNDFLLDDYKFRIDYLTQHFGRMWTRFNYFVTIESALVGGKLIFGSGKLSPEVAIVGAIVSLVWYVMGAEDRFLVVLYRDHVKNAAGLVSKAMWNDADGPYRHVGEVDESSKGRPWEWSGWRVERISTTRLAALIPLLVPVAWLGLALWLLL